MSEYAWTVTARKQYWCDGPGRRDHRIPVGAPYVRCVLFPDGDVNTSDRPWMVRVCSDCYCQWGKTMPNPRRRTT